MGNTCLYGATGGKLFAAGRAGERCAVRNSGAHVVIEGAGDHCCEYMTGGMLTALGDVGINFGAGMTGGFAYVYDSHNNFEKKYNDEFIDIHRIDEHRDHVDYLRGVIEEFVAETQSQWGQTLLDGFEEVVTRFWLVKPKTVVVDKLLDKTRSHTVIPATLS